MPENKPVSEDLAQYYDVIHSDYDYQKDIDFLDKVFHKLPKRQVSTILNVGCGTGNYAKLLARNYFVMGTDNSPAMVALAKKKVPDVDFFVEDMKNFSMERTFDSIVCLSHAINYNLTDEDIERTLRNFARHLEKDGVLVMDLQTGFKDGYVSIDAADTRDGTNVARIGQLRKQSEDTALVNYLFLVKDKKKIDFAVDNHTLKIYSPGFLKRKMKGSGFKRVHIFTSFDFKHYSSSSPHAVIVGIRR